MERTVTESISTLNLNGLELSGVIEKVGKDKGYYMIVEKRGASVLYASADADLTDEIIRAYDTQAPKKTP